MTYNLTRERYNSCEVCDEIAYGRIYAQVYHSNHNRNNNSIHPLEILENLIHANREASGFELLGGGCPLHVDSEKVTEDGFAEMY